jgi:hypothetical protein
MTWSPLTESNRRPSPYHLQFPRFMAYIELDEGLLLRWETAERRG